MEKAGSQRNEDEFFMGGFGGEIYRAL